MQLRVLAEQEHQGSAALLHSHRNRSTGKALTQLRDPSLTIRCSLPHGHKGPHMLVNRQLKLSRLSFSLSANQR
jgi:hypothetical protein